MTTTNDLLDRMADALRNLWNCADKRSMDHQPELEAARDAIAEYDRLLASPSQEKAFECGYCGEPLASDCEVLCIGCGKMTHRHGIKITHPTPEADAVAPVAIGQSDSIEMLAANIMTDCGLSDHGNDRLFQTIQARLYEYTRNRARPAPTVATREAVIPAATHAKVSDAMVEEAYKAFIFSAPDATEYDRDCIRAAIIAALAAPQAPSGSDEGGVG